MKSDRYKETDVTPEMGVDCIMLTLNAEKHLEETLDAWYQIAPIRRVLVIDGGSTDQTDKILKRYPHLFKMEKKGMTTGKAFELLKDLVETPWFIWIDVGKIPEDNWYEEMIKHCDTGDLFGSIRWNYKNGGMEKDKIIADPTKRLLGGPWFIRTEKLNGYHVDDDYAQRNIDIIIRKQLEEAGGRYVLVRSTSHKCYLPNPNIDKAVMAQRLDQNARGIVKYITPEYAKEHASYLLDDHWMLMMNNLPKEWIKDMNDSWTPVLKKWRHRRLLLALSLRVGNAIIQKYKKAVKKDVDS